MTWWIARHAHAGDRGSWGDDDRSRPLSDLGLRQADGIAEQLADVVPAEAVLVSSPAVRCIQTLEPLARRLGTEVVVVDWLTEGNRGALALDRLEEFGDAPVVACSHGDVIPSLLMALEGRGVRLTDDRCQKSSVWTVTTAAGAPTRTAYSPPPSVDSSAA